MERFKYVLILVFLPVLVFSQSGTISGYVLSYNDEGPLVGANVVIPELEVGAATGTDGRFIISGVSQGNYQLKISYIGYETKTVELNIDSKSEQIGDILLKPKTVKGETVTISAQAQGQLSAINQQISSNTIKNIVSSERIREFPDNSAAKAVSRLPGVSLQGDNNDKIVIRGVQSKMNKVQVNGIDVPSTGLGDRSVNMGFISANMLSSIEVSKVLTPDMGADAAGGVVDLKLKEAPDEFQADLMVQGSANLQEETYGNYKIWGSLSNRFFDDKLGVFIQGNVNNKNKGYDAASVGYSRLTSVPDPGYGDAVYQMMGHMDLHKRINKINRYGGSLILDYRYSNGKIVLHNMLSKQKNNTTDFHDDIGTSRTYSTDRDKNTKQLITNSLQGEHSMLGMDIDYQVSNSFSDKETDLKYSLPFTSGVSAMDPLSTSEVKKMDFNDFFGLEMYQNDWKKASTLYGITDYGDYDENQTSASFDIKRDFGITKNISGMIKLGGDYEHKYRETDEERLEADLGGAPNEYHNSPTSDFLASIGADPAQPIVFEDFRNNDFGRGEDFFVGKWNFKNAADVDKLDKFIELSSSNWWRHFAESHKDDYSGTEDLTGGYLMGELDLFERLSIITGLRYEHMKTDYKSYFTVQTNVTEGYNVDTLNKTRTNRHWFPNLNIEYNINDWLDTRIAFTKSIMRPDYDMFLPNAFADITEGYGTGERGNPGLKPAISRNVDLQFSAHSDKIGLLTIGGFYKEISNMFYSTTTLYKNLPEKYKWDEELPNWAEYGQSSNINTYVNNPYDGHVKGIEFSWQTNFRYLPQPFTYLVVNTNYSHMWSSTEYPQFAQERRKVDDSGLVPEYETVEIDTSRTGRLLHQGNDIANIAVGYDYKGLSARISFAFQGNVLDNVGSRPETDSFTEDRYKWDFTLKQKLPLDGLQLLLSGVNITNSPYQTYRKFYNSEDAKNKTEHINYKRYSGRELRLGLRYKL